MRDWSASPGGVFIAACSENADFAGHLARDLRAALGSDAVTLRGLEEPVDDAARAAVDAMVRERDAFVVVLAPAAMASPWINHLVDVAWAERNSAAGKLIVPVLLCPCEVRDDLDTLQRVSFVPPRDYATALNDLLADLRASAASGQRSPVSKDAATPVPREEFKPRRPARRTRIRTVVAALALIAGTVSVLAIAHVRSAAPNPLGQREATATPTGAPFVFEPAGPALSWPIPGLCQGDSAWSFDGRPGRLSYKCLSDSVLVTANNPTASGDGDGGIVFSWQGGGAPSAFKTSVHVAGLTSGACVSTTLFFWDGKVSKYYDVFVCRDGRWAVQYGGDDQSVYMVGQGTVGPLGDFDLSTSCEGPRIRLGIGRTFHIDMTDPIPPPKSAFAGDQLAVEAALGQSGSARFSAFQIQPLHQAANG
jgi:hypothetical protein